MRRGPSIFALGFDGFLTTEIGWVPAFGTTIVLYLDTCADTASQRPFCRAQQSV
jgi:hypothetical protein